MTMSNGPAAAASGPRSQATASARTIRRPVAGEVRPGEVRGDDRGRPPGRVRRTSRRAAPRDSASMPAAPLPANRSRTGRARQVRLEDREQRLLDAIGQRPRARPGRLEPDAARRAGDDPAGVSHAGSPLRPPGRSRAARRIAGRDPAQPAELELARSAPAAADPAARRRRAAPRRAARARTASSRCAATWSEATRSRGKPLWARPRTSPSRRSSKSFSASSKPSFVSATALRRACATSSVESETRTQNDSTVPRPTRPRSWWSWASPNRSAPSMTIIVAAGTSTPDLDDRRPDQHVQLAVAEPGHLGVALGRLEPAVDHARPGAGRAARRGGRPRSRRRRRRRPRRRPPR